MCDASTPAVAEHLDLLDRAAAGLAMGEDRGARPPMGRRGRLEHPPIPWRRSAVAAGHLDDPGAMVGPPDDGARIVESIDPELDLGREQIGHGLDVDPVAPMGRAHRTARGGVPVGATILMPVRRARLGQLLDVAAGIARHRVDDGAQSERRRGPHLDRHPVDVGQVEVGRQQDRPAAVDDEVLVRVRDAQLRRVDVAEHGPDEAHRTDHPPSILSSCPVTTRDSSDRK